MDRRVTPPKRVTSPTWGPPPPCKQTLRIYLCISRDFVNQHACFLAARFTLRQPRTPVRNVTNLRSVRFEDYRYAFQETLCPVTLAH